MKAIRVHAFGGPEVLMVEEVPDLRPGPGQVLVQVYAAGVNPVDTYIRAGWYPIKPALPYTPGIDAAGVVRAVGDGVADVPVGQRVYAAGTLTGAYAQQALCEAAQVSPLPDRYTFEQGAGLYTVYATAYRALFHRAAARPDEMLLVHGASGGVGIAAIQWARAAGMRIIATAGSEKGRRLVAQQGAHHVLDHHEPAHFEQALALTARRGVDVILEMLANVNLGRDLPILALGGRVVVVGSRGPVEIDPRTTMASDTSILGMSLKNAPPRDLAAIRAAINAGLARGTLDPVVGREYRLEQADKAHRDVIEGKSFGKIILVP